MYNNILSFSNYIKVFEPTTIKKTNKILFAIGISVVSLIIEFWDGKKNKIMLLEVLYIYYLFITWSLVANYEKIDITFIVITKY